MASAVSSAGRADAASSDWSETPTTAAAPTDADVHYTPVHPLDSPLASFNNHSGARIPISERLADKGLPAIIASDEPPEDPISPVFAQNDQQGFGGPHSTLCVMRGKDQADRVLLCSAHTASVNPFHRLSHPKSPGNDALPPLPFAANHPVSAGGPASSTPQPGDRAVAVIPQGGQQLLAPVHVTRVTSDTVELVPAVDDEGQSIQPSNGIFGRIGGRFRRKGTAGSQNEVSLPLAGRDVQHDVNYARSRHSEGRLSAAMSVGQAPPSPPTSEDEPEQAAGRADDAQLEASRLESGDPVTTAGVVELGPPILDARRHSFTAEPDAISDKEDDQPPPPPAKSFNDQPVLRQGSAQSEVGSLYNNHPPPLPAGPTRTGSLAAVNLRKKPSLETGLGTPRASARRQPSGQGASNRAAVREDDYQQDSDQDAGGSAGEGTLPVMEQHSRVQGYAPNDAVPAKPVRRNTTGAASSNGSPVLVRRSPLLQSQSQMEVPGVGSGSALSVTRSMTPVPGIDGAALDSDILAEADKLRRERLSRRQKQRQDSLVDEGALMPGERGRRRSSTAVGRPEAGFPTLTGNAVPQAPSQSAPAVGADQEPALPGNINQERVLVGNLIGEDHVNYVLMYNMLTGIRIGVSPAAALPKSASIS